jgi:hypothetical protein
MDSDVGYFNGAIFAPRDQSKEQRPRVTSNTGLAVKTAIEQRDSSMDAASTENWRLAELRHGWSSGVPRVMPLGSCTTFFELARPARQLVTDW